jgi:hypothetical protein
VYDTMCMIALAPNHCHAYVLQLEVSRMASLCANVCQARQGDVAYVCSTNQGAILELSMPSLKQVGKTDGASDKRSCMRCSWHPYPFTSSRPRQQLLLSAPGRQTGAVHCKGARQLGGTAAGRQPVGHPAQPGQGVSSMHQMHTQSASHSYRSGPVWGWRHVALSKCHSKSNV